MKKQQSKKIQSIPKEIMRTHLQIKTQKIPKKKIDLSILLNLKIKNLRKAIKELSILRIQKFYILMIRFLMVLPIETTPDIWTKLN